MSKALTAALLSACVIPGAGHLYLKHYLRAAGLIIIALACVSILVIEATQLALAIVEHIQAQGGVISAPQLIELSKQASENSDSFLSSAALLLLGASWIIGLIDAYRLGRHDN